MSNLLDISGGAAGTTSSTSTSSPTLGVTLLPGLSPIGGVTIGDLAGVQVGSTPAATTTAPNLLNADVNLLLGLNLGAGLGASSGSGSGSSTGAATGAVSTGVGLTTPIGGLNGGVGVSTGTGTGSTSGTGGDPGTGAGTSTPSGSLPDAHTAYQNIFRASAADVPASVSAQLDTLDQMVASGQITAKQAILQIVHAAAGSAAVAETSYQFFSGLTPTSDGLTYLVHSAANPSDLNDSYYSSFDLENRYINFASNLGLHSDYSAAFAQVYGAMTFDGAVSTAYDRIVGDAQAQAAGIDPQAAIAGIEAQQSYFQQIAQERFGTENQDLSTKLAAIAYIMEEAVKANVGAYGVADQNFLYDLADGKAQFHVDLVATYGKGTPLDVTSMPG